MEDQELESFVKFIFELGQLKRTPRSGWLKLGIDNPETVADHSFRTAALGFFLAVLEGENPHEVAGFCLFHDIAETRTLDLDWLAQDYLEKDDYLSSKVLEDQIEGLPEDLRDKLNGIINRGKGNDRITRIARDADLLDLLFQALEYSHQGNPLARPWFFNSASDLTTKSGKRIAKYLAEKEESGELEELLTWWKSLKVRRDRDN